MMHGTEKVVHTVDSTKNVLFTDKTTLETSIWRIVCLFLEEEEFERSPATRATTTTHHNFEDMIDRPACSLKKPQEGNGMQSDQSAISQSRSEEEDHSAYKNKNTYSTGST